jgi:hypothetical protein
MIDAAQSGKPWNTISIDGRVTRMANLDDVLIFVKVAQFEERPPDSVRC